MRTTTRLGMTNIINSRACSSKIKIFESTKDEKFEISISAPKDEKLERWLTRPAKIDGERSQESVQCMRIVLRELRFNCTPT